MSLDADTIVDRRRMRRKLTFWRVFAIRRRHLRRRRRGRRVARARHRRAHRATGGSIARVTITGLIRSDQERVEALERLGKSRARAVIVHINSPGGTTAGSEQLHDALMRLKEQKPMVVVVDGLAASGGYIAAMAADHIVAQETSLVGSIGVLFQYPNVTDLLKTIGVKVEEIKSSPLKAAPNGFEPTSARGARRDRGDREGFLCLVQRPGEGAPPARRRGVRTRGRRPRLHRPPGLSLKLVDELGDERAAIAWLAKEKNIDPKTPVRDYRLRDRFGDLPFLHTAVVTGLDAVGLGSFARRIEEWGAVQAIERLNLDGLLALWHPPAAN